VIGAARSQGTLGAWCRRNSRRARRLFLEHGALVKYFVSERFPGGACQVFCV
jgi:hypothetical protein